MHIYPFKLKFKTFEKHCLFMYFVFVSSHEMLRMHRVFHFHRIHPPLTARMNSRRMKNTTQKCFPHPATHLFKPAIEPDSLNHTSSHFRTPNHACAGAGWISSSGASILIGPGAGAGTGTSEFGGLTSLVFSSFLTDSCCHFGGFAHCGSVHGP